MNTSTHRRRRWVIVAGGLFAALLLGWVWAYEPVTRNIVAQDMVCYYCHLEWEYNPDELRTSTRSHLAESDQPDSQSRCVDCHLPTGWWNATYAYTHILSITDLFGHFRDRAAERSGDWIPPRAATAYRVRDRMYEYDSITCRGCHVEGEIKFSRKRGERAHERALEKSQTCIECHNNLVHREVPLRDDAFEEPDQEGS